MAFAFITEFPIQADDRTTANYDAVNDDSQTRKRRPASSCTTLVSTRMRESSES